MATVERTVLKNVRISYPHIFNPETFEGQDTAKYGCVLIIEKDDPQVKNIKSLILKAAAEKFQGKIKDGKLPSSLHNPLKDGDDKADTNPEYEGCYVISTSTKTAPYICDRRKRTLTEDDGTIYPGCFVNASIAFGAFDISMKKGVAAYLNGIQFNADGERLAGHDASGDFDQLDEDEFSAEDYDI